MKRILSLFLVLLTAFCICSCSIFPESDPENEPDDGHAVEDLSDELFEKLNGVWVKKDGYATTFLSLSKENGKVLFSAGVPFSDYIFSGDVDEITKTGSIYFFTVHVPERKADSLSDGWAAHDLTLTVGTSRIGEHIINANDYASDGKASDFTRFADSLTGIDWSPLFEEDDPADQFDTALADDLWNRIAGIWLCTLDGASFFSDFTREGDVYAVSQGVPASGFVIGGAATAIDRTTDTYHIDLHIPERHDTGEGAEMDYDSFDVETVLTVNADGTITYTLWADSGEEANWSFWAADWDSIDWEAYFDSLPEG